MASLSIPYSDFVSGTTIVSQQVDDNNTAIVNYINARNAASANWDAVSTVGAFTSTLTSNQIILGTTRTVTITAPTPGTTSRAWTIPDITADGTFASLTGTQTFTGAKTFSSAVAITATSNHIVLSTSSNTLTLSAAAQASSARTWTIPDISGNGTFAALEGSQSFSGIQTLTNGLILTGAPTNQYDTTKILYINSATTKARVIRFAGAVATDQMFYSSANNDDFRMATTSGTTITDYFIFQAAAPQFTLGNGSAGVNIRLNTASSTGASVATITNSPTAGNPTEWIQVNINGNTRRIPAWA